MMKMYHRVCPIILLAVQIPGKFLNKFQSKSNNINNNKKVVQCVPFHLNIFEITD